jgi:hypothetical protein
MAEYFPIDLPFPRALPIKTTDEFGAYARQIYESLGLAGGWRLASLRAKRSNPASLRKKQSWIASSRSLSSGARLRHRRRRQ